MAGETVREVKGSKIIMATQRKALTSAFFAEVET
jgi:hypothetical protein